MFCLPRDETPSISFLVPAIFAPTPAYFDMFRELYIYMDFFLTYIYGSRLLVEFVLKKMISRETEF